MRISNDKAMKQLFATGNVCGLTLVVDRSPRIIAKTTSGNTIELDPQTGKSSGHSSDFVLKRLRDGLTYADISESFSYLVVDRTTSQTEKGSLKLALHEFGRDVYVGQLSAPTLSANIRINEGEDAMTTAESRVGIVDSEQFGRLIFNIEGSTKSNEPDYDRVLQAKYVELLLCSKTGKYRATKKEACKSLYAPLAGIEKNDISDDDLIELIITNAPQIN
jgi:hypothetical protein